VESITAFLKDKNIDIAREIFDNNIC